MTSSLFTGYSERVAGGYIRPEFQYLYGEDDEPRTVDDLFAEIEEAIDREAFELSVTYHETLGYPMTIFIDYEENTIDDEVTFRASALVELN